MMKQILAWYSFIILIFVILINIKSAGKAESSWIPLGQVLVNAGLLAYVIWTMFF